MRDQIMEWAERQLRNVEEDLRRHADSPPETWGTPAAIAPWMRGLADDLKDALEQLEKAGPIP